MTKWKKIYSGKYKWSTFLLGNYKSLHCFLKLRKHCLAKQQAAKRVKKSVFILKVT